MQGTEEGNRPVAIVAEHDFMRILTNALDSTRDFTGYAEDVTASGVASKAATLEIE